MAFSNVACELSPGVSSRWSSIPQVGRGEALFAAAGRARRVSHVRGSLNRPPPLPVSSSSVVSATTAPSTIWTRSTTTTSSRSRPSARTAGLLRRAQGARSTGAASLRRPHPLPPSSPPAFPRTQASTHTRRGEGEASIDSQNGGQPRPARSSLPILATYRRMRSCVGEVDRQSGGDEKASRES